MDNNLSFETNYAMWGNYDLFIKNLKVYYNLALRALSGKKQDKRDFLLKNSFLYSNSLGNYKILNSVAEIMKEQITFDKNDYDLMMVFFKKSFVEFYERCPDFSNIFIVLVFEFLEMIHQMGLKNQVGKELKLNLFTVLNRIKESLILKSFEKSDEEILDIALQSVVHKTVDNSLIKIIKNIIPRKKKFDNASLKKCEFLYFPNLVENMNREDLSSGKAELFDNTKFFKLRKIKLKNFNKSSINFEFAYDKNLLFYDECDYHDDDEFDNITIRFSKTNYKLLSMIKDFIEKLKILNISYLIIINDDITQIENYIEYFVEKGIIVYHVQSSESVNQLREIILPKTINLFNYRYKVHTETFAEIRKFWIKDCNFIKLHKFQDFDNEECYFISLSEQCNYSSIIIFSSSLEYSKIIKNYIERVIKLIVISKNYSNKFITVNKIFEVIEETLTEFKSNNSLKNLTSVIEKLFTTYKIKRKISKCAEEFYESVGKM